MGMTPEEIDRIYIQEHGMTKGAFSVGLQGSLMHRNSVEEWAEGDTIKKPIMVLPGGSKSQERRASRPLFFLCICQDSRGTKRADCALGSFVMLYFFRHINNETNKNRRGVFGVQGLLPLGEPRNTCRILRQVVRGTEMRTRGKCVQL